MSERPDTPARERIRTALDETLFVEAGAGSGKTSALVDRVLALVHDGVVPLASIAAITFTEKAATELRDRIRARLDARFAKALARGDDLEAARTRVALDELDGAAIGTLHSFAQRILSEHPVEAGLPPRIEVLDEVTSMVDFENRWTDFLDDLLEQEEMARPVLLLTSSGVRIPALREIALSFNQNWDLVVDHAPLKAEVVPQWEHHLGPLLTEVDAIVAERQHCLDEADTLLPLLDDLADWARQLRQAPDESGRLHLIRVEGGRPKASPNGKGRKDRWPEGYDCVGLRSRIQAVQDRCEELANEVAHAALVRVAVELRRFTLDAAEERRREGRLEFHDLLVMARQMLRHAAHGPAVRATLAQHYQRLLIDEFQDTDPIQVELAVLVASDEPHASVEPWQNANPAPGRLFFVGDPKQSIYRFRRADIALFLEVGERFGGDGRRLSLTTNHRSGVGVLDWINHVFGELITPAALSATSPRSQPSYEPLVAVRPDPPAGATVSVLGRGSHTDKPSADDIREREAADVAGSIARILAEGWLVDRSSDWENPDWQPARAGDVAILIPTRQPLEFLEPALVGAEIPFRMESSSLVYGSRPIRDLFLTLRAIDDPSDELTTVAALRSPLFGCGDDDLFVFRELHGGRLDFSHRQAESVPADDPVAQALAYLRSIHEIRGWHAPSEIVDRVVRDRRVLELGDGEGRARDLWQRVRAVVDQARAWTDSTHGTLRQYLMWVRHQSAPGSRVPEAVLPETDDDAVRIMTIHAAKGLQFPITIVAGLSTQPQDRPSPAQVVWPPEGGCILNVGRRVTSPAFEAWRPLDEQMSHDERTRLLYVACTRARDHLIVSLHRRQRVNPPSSPTRMTNAELLVEGMGDVLDTIPDADGDPTAQARTAIPTPSPAPLLPYEQWQRERAEALARSSRPRTVAATALTDDGRPDAEPPIPTQLALPWEAVERADPEHTAETEDIEDTAASEDTGEAAPVAAVDPGLQKRPGDLDRPPWRKGRYGTAIGRAVHGVLQVLDLATGEGVDAAVAAQAAAEGLVGAEPRIKALVDAALQAPSVVEAAHSAHWREVHVAVPLSAGRTLEGYVDLLYRRADGGLVVVDYKTGPTQPSDEQLDALVAGYQLQGASYVMAVAAATGEDVVEMTFVFLTPTGPVERKLPDLAAAVAETRHRIAEGTFMTTN